MWFLNRSDTNWPVQSQKQATSLKFEILQIGRGGVVLSM